MTSLQRILKDYRESGALHALVNVECALGGGIFSTKSGDLVMLLALHGRDYECLDPSETNQIARRFESVIRTIDERFRLYQYLLKRDEPIVPAEHYLNRVVEQASTDRIAYLTAKTGKLFSLETYLAVVYEGWHAGVDTFRDRMAKCQSPRRSS